MDEMTNDKRMIGQNIKRYRIRQGMSQCQMAELLWIDRSSLSAYETGKRIPDIFMLWRIADIFGITLDSLVGRAVIQKAYAADLQKKEDVQVMVIHEEMLVEKKNL